MTYHDSRCRKVGPESAQPYRRPQAANLRLSESPECSRKETSLLQAVDSQSMERNHTVAHSLDHASYLAIPAFMYHETHDGF